MTWPLNYTPAYNALMAGNISTSAVQTYMTPLGALTWFIAIFITMIAVYIKTESPGITVIIGLLFFIVAQTWVGLVGQTMFYTIIVLGLAILLFTFYRGG